MQLVLDGQPLALVWLLVGACLAALDLELSLAPHGQFWGPRHKNARRRGPWYVCHALVRNGAFSKPLGLVCRCAKVYGCQLTKPSIKARIYIASARTGTCSDAIDAAPPAAAAAMHTHDAGEASRAEACVPERGSKMTQ